MSTPAAPERWRCDAGDADVALLDVPPVLHHDRWFEVDVRFEVRVPEGAGDAAWHELRVELDGRLQWQRRLGSRNPGEFDSLDYHCRCEVPAGQPLRIRALTGVAGVRRHRLVIEVEAA